MTLKRSLYPKYFVTPLISRIPLLASLCCLTTAWLVACARILPAPPPSRSSAEETVIGKAKAFQLVDLASAMPGIYIDQRYRTSRNVIGAPFYPADLPCLIHESTMAKLKRAQKLLTSRGYQLKVWDAYRPPESHLVLWNKFKNSGYVHEPGHEGRWSWHCYGRAVDVTLVDKDGEELKMPSEFDDFTPQAWCAYKGGDPEVTKNLNLLAWAMTTAGFEILDSEWWHFSDPLPEGAPKPPPVFARDLLSLE
jgi:D-alanyl-D-alanine dipeptidase